MEISIAGVQASSIDALTLTDIKSEEKFTFPVPPDKISVKQGAKTLSFTLMTQGDVKIPSGTQVTDYSWNGFFPGDEDRAVGVEMNWQPPEELVRALTKFMEQNSTLRLVIAQAGISDDVFIESFSPGYSGGAGDIEYSITLARRFPMTMRTVSAEALGDPHVADRIDPVGGASSSTKSGTVRMSNPSSELNVRSGAGTKYPIVGQLNNGAKLDILSKSGNWYEIIYSGKKRWVCATYVKVTSQPKPTESSIPQAVSTAIPSTYAVKSGDTLYTIAKQYLGSGEQYLTLYTLNQTAIDAANKGQAVDRYAVREGLLLKLPTA